MLEQPAVMDELGVVAHDAPLAANAPCEKCEKALAPRYFIVAGRALCERCFQRDRGSIVLALVLGLLAAGATTLLYYAILQGTGLRFVLMPIICGVLVGSVVNRGNRDGGRLWLRGYAMLLTYVATAATYLHSLLAMPEYGTWERALGYALALPFDMALQFKNVVSLVLLALGMHEAFAFSASRPLRVRGPFPVAPPELASALVERRGEALAVASEASGGSLDGG